jgi:hypothetical protein
MTTRWGTAGLWQVIVIASALGACGEQGPGAAPDEVKAALDLAPAPAAADCSALAAQLDAAEDLLADLQDELENTPNGPERWRLFARIKSVRATVARLRAELASCLHPPPLLPDLAPVRVILDRPTGATLAAAALVITNAGPGPARGPFRIAFGVTTGSLFREIDFAVPASEVIQPGAQYTTDFMHGISVNRDATGTAAFVFDALVDMDLVIPETDESNNAYHAVIRDHRN